MLIDFHKEYKGSLTYKILGAFPINNGVSYVVNFNHPPREEGFIMREGLSAKLKGKKVKGTKHVISGVETFCTRTLHNPASLICYGVDINDVDPKYLEANL